jgi:hypothetical protein
VAGITGLDVLNRGIDVGRSEVSTHRAAGWKLCRLVYCVIWLGAASTIRQADAGPPVRFPTLAPHSILPTGDRCASVIPSTPETNLSNVPFNHTVPTPPQLTKFHELPLSGAVPKNSAFIRVDGNDTGSTDMILRWAACKWGIDEDLVRAQAWTESKWVQGGSKLSDGGGDKRVTRRDCVQGDFADLWDFGCKDCCYQSWGILQTKVYYAPRTWPMIKDSTAFNADYRYAEERVCIDGGDADYFASSAQRPNSYDADIAAGDLDRIVWGCTGMHYSGSWYDDGSLRYISEVKHALITHPWDKR